ncbi:MAG TPA: hypothetical protein VGC18_05570 [Lacisediminihabitans sp.]|uniref:hypothetical protein n=1 Tax=Lacisediminihabitans sp. TaxID=2787631 RepID=UPI002EDABE54
MLTRGLTGVLALAASAVLLTGCASPPPVIGEAERTRMVSTLKDGEWREVSRLYPEAVRPAVSPVRTIPDYEWATTMAACLRAAGFAVTPTDDGQGYSYSSSDGQSPLDFAVTTYSCEVAYPTVFILLSLLGPKQTSLEAAYQRGVVRPCLLLAGAPSPAPDQLALRDAPGTSSGWDPYQGLLHGAAPDATVRFFEQRCPPVPPWLQLSARAGG